MSAVHDEADDGHESSLGNHENLDGSDVHDAGKSVRNNGHADNDSVSFSGTTFKRNGKKIHKIVDDGSDISEASRRVPGRPSSADGSLSIPDDTPSKQGSIASSLHRGGRRSNYGLSPTPSLKPFDRRFQSRLASNTSGSSRVPSSLPYAHSRQSSVVQVSAIAGDSEVEAPWEVVRWTKLRKMTGEAFSERGKRQFGEPTCITVSASIALGTSKGIILVFDYNQNLKSIIGPGTRAIESKSVTSIAISADHSTIAGGHATGDIFTWEMAKPAKPFLHIPPIDQNRSSGADGHIPGVAILHLGFLGIRHTALASADDKGMAFSHLASRGMGMVARSVKSTRILGRYPEKLTEAILPKKPSSVLSFSPLPLGNAEHAADNMGLVALLTPYLLVVVSTMPVAQTQYKAPRPKEVVAHGAMTAALAWFPSIQLKVKDAVTSETSSRAKLAYCWSNVLTVLDIVEVEPSDSAKNEPPSLQFKPRSRWKAEEAIVAVQWLSRSVMAVLTITSQLTILEDGTMIVTDSSDLISKHIYHKDLFSHQLNHLVDQLEDDELADMHGFVADAFYMSFRAYKGRLFLLGENGVSFGTLSNWADRLLALMEDGSYVGAIQLATGYYTGEADKVTVGLPEDDNSRHRIVQEKLLEMMMASLRYAFAEKQSARNQEADEQQKGELASACIDASISMNNLDFLFDDAYIFYSDHQSEGIFLENLEPHIRNDEIVTMPPIVIKDLVGHYTARGYSDRLEEMICHLDPRTMDLDQITTLCKKNGLYDALLYVWNQAMGDYTTVMNELLDLVTQAQQDVSAMDPSDTTDKMANASKIFTYLSYILTSRVYPTGKAMTEEFANLAKADIYHYFFSGRGKDGHIRDYQSPESSKATSRTSYPNLRRILEFDSASFLSMMNEAFEDAFLNGPQERMSNEEPGGLTEEQKFGLSVNRQWIVSILLEVMIPPNYEPDDTIYLDMFIARNLPKFPQFVLLSGHTLQRVLVGLCQYPSDDLSDDCQLSVEYLLSTYQPPDSETLIPLLSEARFYRVLKSIYKADSQYAKLLKTCFEDSSDPDAIFDCIKYCLRPGAGLREQQVKDVRAVIIHHAEDMVRADVSKAASTIDQYAPDLHETLLDTLVEDESERFQYLRTILEPSEPTTDRDTKPRSNRFVELYVRLLCIYNPSHVSKYVQELQMGDLRLDEVLPDLENSGNVDAAIILMAREGRVRESIDRLKQHLKTLESALLGLLEGVIDSPDLANTSEASRDLVSSIQKYARIGIWLCQNHTKAARHRRQTLPRTRGINSNLDTLSADEELWLDLIDAVVGVTKNVSELVEHYEQTTNDKDQVTIDSMGMISDLRTVVQDTFTALLSTTSATRTNDIRRTDVSFLRILRAFLGRASLSSPSISNLRSVLSAIFSAYSYEESLLALSNRLLDKDLFVNVTEADSLRRRGWRPLGQVCEGCSKRVWGPGAGGYIWDAWLKEMKQRNSRYRGQNGQSNLTAFRSTSESRERTNIKGKAVTRQSEEAAAPEAASGEGDEETGAIVIFACRHMFHRSCLEKMSGKGDEDRDSPEENLVCPLEI